MKQVACVRLSPHSQILSNMSCQRMHLGGYERRNLGDACRSEPEAAALLALATHFKPHVWMNVHSGMEALFMPYDHLATIPKGHVAQATLEVQRHPTFMQACGSAPAQPCF